MWPLRLNVFPILQVDVCSLGKALRTEPRIPWTDIPSGCLDYREAGAKNTLTEKQLLLTCFHIHMSFWGFFCMYLLLKLKVSFLSINIIDLELVESWLSLPKTFHLLNPQILVECLPCAGTVLNAGEGFMSWMDPVSALEECGLGQKAIDCSLSFSNGLPCAF